MSKAPLDWRHGRSRPLQTVQGASMPHIVIHLSGQPEPTTSRRVIDKVMELTHAVRGKAPEVTATTLQYIAQDDWFIAGKPFSETGQHASHPYTSVTEESNTKAEHARYLR